MTYVSASLFMSARRGEIPVSGAHDDRAALREVPHRHLARGDARQRAVAAVVGEPCRSPYGRRAESPDGAERPVAGAPQVTDGALRREALAREVDAGRLRAALEAPAEEDQAGKPAARRPLQDLED